MTVPEVREEVQSYFKAQGWRKVDNIFEIDKDADRIFLIENKNVGIIGAVTIKGNTVKEFYYTEVVRR